MNTHPNGSVPTTPGSPGSAVYVDTENLRDNDRAQDVIAQVVAGWPADHPPVGGLSLYVRADKVELWRLWAESAYPALRVRVRGVQHFSNNGQAKNSADLAIAADAIADLLTGQVSFVGVVSNDSDFGALFVKVRELTEAAGREQTPFVWITTPDAGGLSPEIERFIPAPRFRWDLSDAEITAAEPAPIVSKPSPKLLPKAPRPALPVASDTDKNNAGVSSEAIAEELIRRLPVGKFKASDAQKVIKQRWPERQVAAGDTAQFGQFLGKEIWPLLERRGVTMPGKSSPRTYEITQAAKDSITRPPAAELTPAQLSATVAAGIGDDLFKASDAQAALQGSHPKHPAASYTAQRFGVWFSEQLWPVMQQHGVVIAKEKPRRYEMTPDARHRLTALG